MKDQPLPADASPTALSLGYVVDSDPKIDVKDPKEDPAYYPADRGNNDDDESSNDHDDDDDVEKEKDEKDPKEDPAYYHADRGNNDDDESSNDDDNNDDVEKDEEDKEEEEHLALADPSDEMMATVNQGMGVEEIEQVTKRQKEEVAENASKKRKWESNHHRSLSQQNKGHKVPRAHTAWPINKKAHVGSLPLCNQCKFHHSGSCTVKCGNYKKRLDNTSKNNQNQQQPKKKQNIGRAYTARHEEKKHYGGSKPLCSKCNYHHDGPCAPK
nr:reverse transcriptase domain-containing protein [Tanacetum cinerariifolium]